MKDTHRSRKLKNVVGIFEYLKNTHNRFNNNVDMYANKNITVEAAFRATAKSFQKVCEMINERLKFHTLFYYL